MSIWITEVDKALKQYIMTLMQGNLDYKIPVKFLNPDIEKNKEEYPCITINSLDEEENLKMTDVNSYTVSSSNGVSTITPKPIKYDLSYQIDFWSKTKSNINELTYVWISNVQKNDILEVTTKDGKDYYECPFTKIGYAKLDSVSKGVAIYRRSYEYKVTIELPVSSKTTKVVGTLEEIKTNITK